jgi:hypothetical protein
VLMRALLAHCACCRRWRALLAGTEAEPGIVPRALAHAFSLACSESDRDITFSLSCYQLYQERAYDLLAAPSVTAEGGQRSSGGAARGEARAAVAHLVGLRMRWRPQVRAQRKD